jgi:hypothetical protein
VGMLLKAILLDQFQQVGKIPFDRLDRIIKATIKDLEKRKDKATVRTETDNLWTKIESLEWVLFVIFVTKMIEWL